MPDPRKERGADVVGTIMDWENKAKEARERVVWNCRFHPTNWWHEVGCPHQDWTKEQLRDALISAKASMIIQSDQFQRDLAAIRTQEE